MNRKNQITKDFAALLNDSRIQLANIIQDADTTRFDVLIQTARRAGVSYYNALDLVASVTLENDYSNIIEAAAEVLNRHPYRNDAPLMRLRRSTLSGKERYTLGVTDSSNLEFFGCKNFKCSDDLGRALMWADAGAPLDVLAHDTPVYMSTFERADEYHLRLKTDEE